MAGNIGSKWQGEIEAILRKQFQGDELTEQVKRADELVNLTQAVEPPSGDTGEVVAQILRMASEDLDPLAAVYTGFQLGVAWERYQNAN